MKKFYESPELESENLQLSEAISTDLNLSLGDAEFEGSEDEF